MKTYYVYIMTNRTNSVLYTGVTNDLERRVFEHQNKLIDGFTSKYNATKLVYFEETEDISAAIEREKQIKGWLRKKKRLLVESANPSWRDLSREDQVDPSPALRMTEETMTGGIEMKKTTLIFLLALVAISCGGDAGRDGSGWIDTDGRPDRPHGPGWFPFDGPSPDDRPSPEGSVSPQTSSVPVPVPEGFVCDGRGICVPEERILKNPPPNVDRFGFRTDVVAVPYDPCKHDGICPKKGEGE